MKNTFIILFTSVFVSAFAIVFGLRLSNTMLQNELVRDAENAAAQWAKYVFSAEPRLAEVFQKKTVEVGVSEVFNRTYPAVRTLYYELYDANRQAFFISYMNVKFEFKSFPAVDKIIDGENGGNIKKIKVAFHHHKDIGEFVHFATVAVPFISSGKILGYVVSYIDQTVQRAALEQLFHRVAMLIGSIFAISIIGPIVILLLKSRDDRKSREAVRKSEELFLKAFHANPTPFSISNPSGLFHNVNEAWLTTLGYSRDEVVGGSSKELGIWDDPEDRSRFVKIMEEHGTVRNYETQFRAKDGTAIDMVITGELVEVDGDTRMFVVARDVTESNRAKKLLVEDRDLLQQRVNEATVDLERKAKELEAALAKEKELNELQRQFVSMASHEFRTPLAIIDQTAQRLKRKIDKEALTPEAMTERIGRIRNAVTRMTRLMESTLMAARLDEGKITIDIQPCDIAELVQEVCSRQQEIAEQHAIVSNIADLPETICVDSGAVDQIITNLLSNAMKYSPSSAKIEVSGRTVGDHVEISVRDYGLGINQDDLPNMFSRFFRAKTAMGIAGTGIGLHMVKTLAQMHDGTVHVESIKGDGSTFTVRLPIHGPAAVHTDHSKSRAM